MKGKSNNSLVQRISDSQPVKVVRRVVRTVKDITDPQALRDAGVAEATIRKMTGRNP